VIEFLNKSPNILVIGDLMIDHYLWGDCNRISPEAPVQVIDLKEETSSLGGAGNVVNNLKTLGANVDVLTVVGDCENTTHLKKLLNQIKVRTNFLITEKNRVTSKKTRVISSNQQVVRYDNESIYDISKTSESKLLKTFHKIINEYDVLLLSDYGKGVLTDSLTKKVIQASKKLRIKTLIDPKGKDFSKYSGAHLITPNKREAELATGIKISDNNSLKNAIKKLKQTLNLDISMITLSEEGIAIYDKGLKIFPATVRSVFDVTGAGDTVLSSLGFALAIKNDINLAAKLSNLAAGVVVGKIGSATASMNEIIEYESSLHKSSSDVHIKDWDEIQSLVNDFKIQKKKIAFTNGCFDIVHSGHIRYLEKSKTFADILIVGINSDKSVSKLKGSSRPINTEKDRAFIIAALECVDYVVIFEEDTPEKLIKFISPDILVKGSDYKKSEVVGNEYVDDVRLVQLVEGKSTTNIIEKIQYSKK